MASQKQTSKYKQSLRTHMLQYKYHILPEQHGARINVITYPLSGRWKHTNRLKRKDQRISFAIWTEITDD